MLLIASIVEKHRRQLSEQEQNLMSHPNPGKRVSAPRSSIPAVTHVDYTARVQTVDEERHGRFYRLMKRFKERTGCPVLINTSFNIRGEPIVCTPQDAYRCFSARTWMRWSWGITCCSKRSRQPSTNSNRNPIEHRSLSTDMKLISRTLLAAIYVLVWLLHLWRALRRQDPLQLRRPAGVSSYWITRAGQPGTASYFPRSPSPKAAARNVGSLRCCEPPASFTLGRRVLLKGARLRRPRKKSIPDEIYTLW